MNELARLLQHGCNLSNSFSKEKELFMIISDYVKIILEHEHLASIIDHVLDEEMGAEQLERKRLADKTISESLACFENVISKLTKRELSDEVIRDRIERMKATKEGHISGIDYPTQLFSATKLLIHDIFHYIRKDVVNEYIKHNNQIEEYTFSPTYFDYEEQKKRMERLVDRRYWGCWLRLIWVYKVLNEREKLLKRENYGKDIMTWLNITGMVGEMDKILNDYDNGQRTEFKSEEYKFLLQRFNLNFQVALIDKDGNHDTTKNNLHFPTGTKWNDITFKPTTSRHILNVIHKRLENIQKLSCEPQGFLDKRTNNSTKQWELLVALVENNGEMSCEEVANALKTKKTAISQIKTRLSKQLIKIMGILGSPIYYHAREKLYKVNFKVTPDRPEDIVREDANKIPDIAEHYDLITPEIAIIEGEEFDNALT